MRLLGLFLVSYFWVNQAYAAGERRFGVEVNPLYIAVGLNAAVSYFNYDSASVLMVPYLTFGGSSSQTSDVENIEIKYRQFLNDNIEGLFIGGLLRRTRLTYVGWASVGKREESRYGMGAEIGYQGIMEDDDYFWNISIVGVRYFRESTFQNEVLWNVKDRNVVNFDGKIGWRF